MLSLRKRGLNRSRRGLGLVMPISVLNRLGFVFPVTLGVVTVLPLRSRHVVKMGRRLGSLFVSLVRLGLLPEFV